MKLPVKKPFTIISQRWQPQTDGGTENWLDEQLGWLEIDPGSWEYAGEPAFEQYRAEIDPSDCATLDIQLPRWARFSYFLGVVFALSALFSPD